MAFVVVVAAAAAAAAHLFHGREIDWNCIVAFLEAVTNICSQTFETTRRQ